MTSGANPPRTPRSLSQCAHRRLIGILELLLPVLLYLIAGARQTTGLASWRPLPSVSAYYYTGAVSVFVGILFALGLFLMTYPGYEGESADRWVGTIGGFGALGVGLFPTAAPPGAVEPTWWATSLRAIHYGSAVVLFGAFIAFSIWLFRKSAAPTKEAQPPDKRRRNSVYLVCGLVMIGCMAWATVSGMRDGDIFWPEAIAIVSFAISWLVKGEAHVPVMNLVRSVTGGA